MLHTQGLAPTDDLAKRKWIEAQIAISVAVAMATLDTAITNTAPPTIASDIGTDGASSIWVVNAYQLAVVATLLPLAALGEIVGHRRAPWQGGAFPVGANPTRPNAPAGSNRSSHGGNEVAEAFG